MNRPAATRFQPGRAAIVALLVGVTAVLSGCGGSSSGATASGGATPAAAPADVSAGQASARAEASAIAAAGGGSADPLKGQNEGGDNPVSAGEFCALMKKEAPKVAKQSTTEAMVTVVSDIADLYAAKHAMAKMDGSKMDALATSCPGDSAKVLKSAGVTGFNQL